MQTQPGIAVRQPMGEQRGKNKIRSQACGKRVGAGGAARGTMLPNLVRIGDPRFGGAVSILLVGEKKRHDEVRQEEDVHHPVENKPSNPRVVAEEAHL